VARSKLGERLGSGDGERKTLLTRQIASEPLPASVLFGLVLVVDSLSCGRLSLLILAESVHLKAPSLSDGNITIRGWEMACLSRPQVSSNGLSDSVSSIGSCPNGLSDSACPARRLKKLREQHQTVTRQEALAVTLTEHWGTSLFK
jgi:hypothetical protein